MAEVQKDGGNAPPNPLEPSVELQEASADRTTSVAHPQDVVMDEDSAVTKAEKVERHDLNGNIEESPAKRRKLDNTAEIGEQGPTKSERKKGVAPIKAESAVWYRYPCIMANSN